MRNQHTNQSTMNGHNEDVELLNSCMRANGMLDLYKATVLFCSCTRSDAERVWDTWCFLNNDKPAPHVYRINDIPHSYIQFAVFYILEHVHKYLPSPRTSRLHIYAAYAFVDSLSVVQSTIVESYPSAKEPDFNGKITLYDYIKRESFDAIVRGAPRIKKNAIYEFIYNTWAQRILTPIGHVLQDRDPDVSLDTMINPILQIIIDAELVRLYEVERLILKMI